LGSEELFDFLKKEMNFKFLIEPGLMPEVSKIVIFGEEKIGKSCLIQNLALDLISCQPFLDIFKVQRGCKVLFIQCEIQEAAFQKRLQKTVKKYPFLPEGKLFLISDLRPPKLDLVEGRDWLLNEIAEIQPDVVFLDPLAKLMAGDPSSFQDMSRFLDTLDLAIHTFKCSIIITHHARKASAERPYLGAQEMTGSKRLADWADAIWGLKGSAIQRAPLEIWFELRHAEEEVAPLFIQMDRETFSMKRVDHSELLANLRPPMQFIMEKLNEHGALRRADLLKFADGRFSERTIDFAIADLERLNIVSEFREGRFLWLALATNSGLGGFERWATTPRQQQI